MPTRQEKKSKTSRWWRLWFLPTPSAESAVGKFRKRVQEQTAERNPVKVLSSEGKQMLLEWERPVKYDAARNNIIRLGAGAQISVEVAEGPAEPSDKGEVAEGRAEPSDKVEVAGRAIRGACGAIAACGASACGAIACGAIACGAIGSRGRGRHA
jgi:hypothetical protein